MSRCPVLIALDLTLRVVDHALGVLDRITAPVTDRAWDRLVAKVLPQENEDV